MKAATWIGNRRWDLTFDSGETLALPEDGAPAALLKFAELDGADRLLGRNWVRFDMRFPDQMLARSGGGREVARPTTDDDKPAPEKTDAADNQDAQAVRHASAREA